MTNPSDLKRLLDALPLLRDMGLMRVKMGELEIEFAEQRRKFPFEQHFATPIERPSERDTDLQGDNHPHIVVDPTLGPYDGYGYDSAQVQLAIDNLTNSRDTDTVDVDNDTTHETSTDSLATEDESVRELADLDLAHIED